MISVDLDSLCGYETKIIVTGINEATDNIKDYIKKHTLGNFIDVCCDIKRICDLWTGKTCVGKRKIKYLEQAFQKFFESFMCLLLAIEDNKNEYSNEEQIFAKNVLYRGKLYRYLGNDTSSSERIVPEFNDIYVSWSKKPKNSYLESKLYGTLTWIACEITEPFYGIDLEAIGTSRGNESEVVFPTIEKCINEIKYISEDCDDEA